MLESLVALQVLVMPLVALLGGGLVTFLGTAYWRSREDAMSLKERIVELEAKVRLQDLAQQHIISQVVPLNTAFQALLMKDLTHAHTPEMDALLVKLGPPYKLTTEDETRLSYLLYDRYRNEDGDVTERERDAARMLPMLMKRVKEEAATLASLDIVVLPGGRPRESDL